MRSAAPSPEIAGSDGPDISPGRARRLPFGAGERRVPRVALRVVRVVIQEPVRADNHEISGTVPGNTPAVMALTSPQVGPGDFHSALVNGACPGLLFELFG